ncbi:MAG: GYF domain-containing protein [Acidobacteriota bacterium]
MTEWNPEAAIRDILGDLGRLDGERGSADAEIRRWIQVGRQVAGAARRVHAQVAREPDRRAGWEKQAQLGRSTPERPVADARVSQAKWLVRVETGSLAARQFEIQGELRIGRAPENEIVIEDNLASRRHASIRAVAGACELTDLGSSNGTVVGENRIRGTVRIDDGGSFSIGRVVFTVVRLFPAAKVTASPERPEPAPGPSPEPEVTAKPSQEREWYYVARGEQQGPLPESSIRELLRENRLPPDTLVWAEGCEGWMPASSAGLAAAAVPGQPVEARACAKCGRAMRASEAFCPGCGAPVRPAASIGARACAKCGAPLGPSAKFCARCGQRHAG